VQKKQYADRKKYATQTGGGPPTKKLSNETEKIVDMIKITLAKYDI
jgi:hypothetical protein